MKVSDVLNADCLFELVTAIRPREVFVATRCQAVENANYRVRRLATVSTASTVWRRWLPRPPSGDGGYRVHRLATVATQLAIWDYLYFM